MRPIFRRSLLLVVVLSTAGALCGHAQMMQAIVNGKSAAPVSYVGPGDVVAGAGPWYGLRGYSAAVAATNAAIVQVLRNSDSATLDIHVLSNGDLDSAAAAAFAGTDATATCTLSSTTLTCTGASSTPNVNDPVSGTSIAQPCVATAVGTFTSGAGTVTVSNPITGASCGTVGSGETVTFQVGLSVWLWYDQISGGTNNLQQQFTGPRLLLNCLGTSHNRPCTWYYYGWGESISGVNMPNATGTISAVAARTPGGSAQAAPVFIGVANPYGAQFANSANTVQLYQGILVSATASDLASHAIQFVMNTTTSHIDVDGTPGTTGDDGGGAIGNVRIFVGFNGAVGTPNLMVAESGIWQSTVFSSGQSTSMHANQSAYWGTP